MKIKEGIYVIPCMYDSSVNIYLFAGDNMTLVGTGTSTTPDQHIFPYMKMIGLDPKDIVLVINTHGHSDHIGGDSRVLSVSGAKLAAHSLDKPWIEDHEVFLRDMDRYPLYFPISDTSRRRFNASLGENTKVDIGLNEGDEIEAGNGQIRILHTPGHSAGSISLHDTDEKILFVGDSIQAGLKHMPFYNDAAGYVKTLERLLELDVTLLLTSHYPPLRKEDAETVINRSLLLVKMIGENIVTKLAESKTPVNLLEITKFVCNSLGYRWETIFREDHYRLSLWTVEAQLTKLFKENKVQKTAEKNEVLWSLS